MPTALVLVLDAVGLVTLNYLLDQFPGKVSFPRFSRLGLGRLVAERHQHRFESTGDSFRSMAITQASATADSVIGHREMMGIVDARTYNLFPGGFPFGYIAELECRIGRRTMFNRMGGGVEVIEDNAAAHARTGYPIVYSSKCDPLIQIAMDEAVIPVPEQHRIADSALALALEMNIPITRAIARAFIRSPEGGYTRTANRHDAVLPLPGRTLVDILRDRGIWTVAVGKPSDLVNTVYDRQYHLAKMQDLHLNLGLRFVHPKRKDTNPFTTQGVINALTGAREFHSSGAFVFANWVDTDALYGHTRDVEGAIRCIEECDRVLLHIEASMQKGDLLIITADHGMDHRSDYGYHSLEPVPLLMRRIGYGSTLGDIHVGIGEGLTEVGMLVAQFFNCAGEFHQSIIHVPA